jgi:predicted nucleic acid-binding protein
MILVDTSVWIEAFRRPARVTLEEHASFDEIATCGPVVQEVLQGFGDERAFRVARDAMLALPRLDEPHDDHLVLAAVDVYRRARRAGISVRSSIDCLIAAAALRHDAVVLHRDRDFDGLARISSLRVRSLPR